MNRRQILASTGAVASLGLCAGIVAGAPGCTPAPAAEPISADLAFAIERHRAALADMEASGRVQEACERAMRTLETPGTRSAFDAADDAFNLDCEREQAAHNRVIAAPIVTLADMRAKASYLASVSRHMIHDDGTMAALLASMGASTDSLSAVSIEPDPLLALVQEYTATLAAVEAAHAVYDDAFEADMDARVDPLWHCLFDPPAATTEAGGNRCAPPRSQRDGAFDGLFRAPAYQRSRSLLRREGLTMRSVAILPAAATRPIQPPAIRSRRALRHAIEHRIEALMAALDEMDGDPDDEPSLGWATTTIGVSDDREDDAGDEREIDDEREPSLAATEDVDHGAAWAAGAYGECLNSDDEGTSPEWSGRWA